MLPSRAYEYLAAFLPGLFFMFSIALANPDFVLRIEQRSLVFGRYAIFGMAVVLAFVIGQAFIFIDTLIQWLFSYAHRVKILFYRKVCEWPLRQFSSWLMAKPQWQRYPAIAHFHFRVSRIASTGFQDWRAFQGCWHVFARRLLKVRYGIESTALKDDELGVLYSNLGTLTSEEFRGSMVLIASHATGWAGLVATRIAPSLRNRWFVGLSVFLILNGLLHAYYVTLGRFDIRISGVLQIAECPQGVSENRSYCCGEPQNWI